MRLQLKNTDVLLSLLFLFPFRHKNSCGQSSQNFICNNGCGKFFTRRDALKRHEKKCVGVKSKRCAICFKEFKSTWFVKRHELIHAKGSYQCRYCDENYSRIDHFQRHTNDCKKKKNPKFNKIENEISDKGNLIFIPKVETFEHNPLHPYTMVDVRNYSCGNKS